ncbi:metallophosphoesterase [Ruminococcus sp.]|uniref:metallophosphoesterase n=1 Tax=Ruminococcus sp. TaxID=41978 RepID=UPI0038905837
MIYITGDTHGDYEIFNERRLGHLKKNDTLIITGDFGFIWDNSKEELKNLKKLSKKKFEILFVEGAHENFELLQGYEEVPLHEGTARKIADNIYCLNRGELYRIGDKTIFALGGGLPPEADETEEAASLPTDEELEYAVVNLQEQHRYIDLIITHEAPASVKRMIDRRAGINDLNIFLDTVMHNTRWQKWYFGSLHEDRAISENLICVFEEVYRFS